MSMSEVQVEKLAFNLHKGQFREWTIDPYIVHPMSVRELVRIYLPGNKFARMAALLHDVIEDCSVTGRELVDLGVEKSVVGWVEDLTDVFTKENYPTLNRAERKKREHERLALCCDAVVIIKLCDMMHNFFSTPNDEPFKEVFKEEIKEFISMINDRPRVEETKKATSALVGMF